MTTRQWRDWDLDVIHIADGARDRLAPFLPATWRHHRIDNPISVARSSPAEIDARGAFAYVGRLTSDKGAIIMARAAARAGAPAIFIGEGPARQAIASILPNAEITGWLATSEVARLLRTRARALVAPSLWPETGPLTVGEAAAMGLPAIVSSRCGASEKVALGAGIVVEPTEEALASAMRSMAEDAVAARMGEAAYEAFWSAPPTLDAHAVELLGLYEEILTRRHAV